jgi:hypothetical protein
LTTRKKTEISVQIDRMLVISTRLVTSRAWCKSCGKRVVMLRADEAARLAGVSSRTLYRWVEDRLVHFTETQDQLVLVCLDSVPPSNIDHE